MSMLALMLSIAVLIHFVAKWRDARNVRRGMRHGGLTLVYGKYVRWYERSENTPKRGWYFRNEAEMLEGPFADHFSALEACEEYVTDLERGRVEEHLPRREHPTDCPF